MDVKNYSVLEIIALIFIGKISVNIIWKLLKGLWTCGLGYSLGFGVKWNRVPKSWAVVTGGTDGIGLGYAKQLAKMGYSVLILSRNEQKLKSVANDIEKQFPQCNEVKTLAVDFINTDIYPKISDMIDSLPTIDVLVNNVGTANTVTEYFTKIPYEMNDKFVDINLRSYIKMCEIILPKMVKQKNGIIINISSQFADIPSPFFTVYASTKAFTDYFSRGLSIEYAQKGITIQTVCPGAVITKLIPQNVDVSLAAVPVDDFVSSAIKTVGIEWRTYGHWKHKLISFMVMHFGMRIFGSKIIGELIMKVFKYSRSKYYKENNMTDDF